MPPRRRLTHREVSPNAITPTNTSPVSSIPRMTFLPSLAASAKGRNSASASIARTLTFSPRAVQGQRPVDRVRVGGPAAEPGGRLDPGLAVAADPLGPEVRAARDQLGELADGVDVARRRDAYEALRVQVVAE